MTGLGFRAMARTILDEELRFRPDLKMVNVAGIDGGVGVTPLLRALYVRPLPRRHHELGRYIHTKQYPCHEPDNADTGRMYKFFERVVLAHACAPCSAP